MSFPKPSKRGPKLRRKPRRKRKGKRASLRRQANDLWSLIVKRPQRCESQRENHAGPFQAAHGFPKKSYPAVRYLPVNGWCLCAGCHKYYTHKPLEWTDFMEWDLGKLAFQELRYLALKNEKQDMPSVLEKLRDEAKRLGIE